MKLSLASRLVIVLSIDSWSIMSLPLCVSDLLLPPVEEKGIKDI